MTAPTTFTHNLFGPVRSVGEESGEVWFIAKDIAVVLGYANPRKAISDHCKAANKKPLPTAGGIQDVTIIPERDIYRLVMRSRLPAAEKFEEWVVSEVLPSIRKTGSYAAAQSFQVPQTFADALRLAADQQERIEAQNRLIEQQKPKVEYHDEVLSCSGLMSLSDALKSIGYKPIKSIGWLRENGYLGHKNKPYQKHIDAGRFKPKQVKTRGDKVVTQTMVTTKGAEWLARVLSLELELRAGR